MDSLSRASELYKQVCSGTNDDEHVRLLTAGMRDDEPLVRHIALMCAAQHCRIALSPDAIRELVDTLLGGLRGDWPSWQDDYLAATDGNDLEQDLVLALAELEPGWADEAIEPLFSRFRQDPQSYEMGHAVIGLTFPRRHSDSANDALNDDQVIVLCALLANTAIWSCDMDLPRVLFERGLPKTRNGIALLLEDPSAYRPRRRTRWRIVQWARQWFKSLFQNRPGRGHEI
jgi:hypothetical protein